MLPSIICWLILKLIMLIHLQCQLARRPTVGWLQYPLTTYQIQKSTKCFLLSHWFTQNSHQYFSLFSQISEVTPPGYITGTTAINYNFMTDCWWWTSAVKPCNPEKNTGHYPTHSPPPLQSVTRCYPAYLCLTRGQYFFCLLLFTEKDSR